MQIIPFHVRGEFITLDRLLKAVGVAGSGGGAKALVAEGKVQVDGRDELRKTAKLRPGQVVSLTGWRIQLRAEADAAADSAATDADAEANPDTDTPPPNP